MNKKTVISVAVLLCLVLVAGGCYFAFQPETNVGSKTITVQVTHLDGTQNTYEFATDAEYLFQALQEQKLIGELVNGYFTEFDGETANEANQEWWGYTKSGEYVSYGVSECVIADGDHYEFTLNVGW